jgi:hypothetical protein
MHRIMSTPTIRVTFVDSSNGALLGVVDLTPSRLPRSFAPATTLHLGDDDWEVVRAEPSSAEEYERSRQLRLELRHIVPTPKAADAISPNKMLVSLPTIADSLPAATIPRRSLTCSPSAESGPSGEEFELGEDEWRQIEMIHVDTLDRVRDEFRAIERVMNEERLAAGFRTCHARRAVEAPMDGTSLSLDQLRAAFPHITQTFGGLAFRGRDTLVDHGFAFRAASGLVVYGVAAEARVSVLGLVPDRSRKSPPLEAGALGTLRNTHALVLVDWCARVAVQPTRN